MEGKPVVQGIDPSTLSEQEKREALEAVNLIKEKRDGNLKGRLCINDAKQRKYIKDEENISSPTALLEGIFGTLIIDAYDERDVAIADVSGAYLHAEWPKHKKVILKLRDEFGDIMCNVNPKYKEHVITKVRNGKSVKVLYLIVLRALYGALESALLGYKFV